MRLILLPVVAAAVLAPSALPDRANSPAPADCADRIQQVRDLSGQPKLDRSPTTPGQGYLIAAVDKRVDGCPVMQMLHDADDLRPLPKPNTGLVRLMPAR